MSDSLRLYGLWPTRLLCLWDSPGKNTGVGCHALLQGIFQTQGSNQNQGWNLCLLRLLHWQAGSLPPGKPLPSIYERKKESEVAQSCLTLCDPMDSSLHQAPLSTGFFKARVLEWGAIAFSWKEGVATHSSIVAWRRPWTEEPGGLQSIESQRVGHG